MGVCEGVFAELPESVYNERMNPSELRTATRRKRLAHGWLWLLLGLLFTLAFYRSAHHPALADQFQNAKTAYREGKLDVVLIAAETFQGLELYLPHAHLLDGMLLLQREHLPQALAEFRLAREHQDTRVLAHVLAGETLYKMKKFGEAQQYLKKAIVLEPKQLEARRLLAAIHYNIGAMNQAVAELEEIARLAPSDPRPHRLLGLIQKDFENYEQAIVCYQESLRRDPNQAERFPLRVELAECHLKELHYRGVLATLKQVPASANTLWLQAVCHHAQQDTQTAHRLIKKSLKLNPEHLGAQQLQAIMALEADDVPRAVSVLEQALQQHPKEFELHYHLARAYQRLGQQAKAENHQQKMEQLRTLRKQFTQLHEQAMREPNNAELRYQLGLAAMQLDRNDLAQDWFTAAVAMDAQHQAARKALRKLLMFP